MPVASAIRARHLVVTGLIARLGIVPLAGYSIGQRLEFLLIPIAFGVGVASIPMVGMAMGAGQVARARRVAWIAACVSGVNLGLIGLIVTAFPHLWAGMFSSDPAVLDAATQYLRWAGPGFGFFGFGLTLYFAAQGLGKILGPVLASTARLVGDRGRRRLAGHLDRPALALVCAGRRRHGGLRRGKRGGDPLDALGNALTEMPGRGAHPARSI